MQSRLLKLVPLLLWACSTQTIGTAPSTNSDAGGSDSGVADAGPSVDAGTPDAGSPIVDAGPSDAGVPADAGFSTDGGVSLQPVAIVGDRRGPVLLYFKSNAQLTGFTLDLMKSGVSSPATTESIAQVGGDVLAVWDSFADLQTNTLANLTLSASHSGATLSASIQVSIKNDPETDRIILVGHDLAEDVDAGAATQTGTDVTAFTWSGTSGQVTGTPTEVTVGQGPQDLRAAPHGRASAVVEATSGNVTLLATPLSADSTQVQAIGAIKLPQGSAADARWSHDGRYLYIVSQGPSALWRVEPSEDLSSIGSPVMLASLPGPPFRFDVDPVTGMILVACGDDSNSIPVMALYKPDGTEAARLEQDLDAPNALVIHPAGGYALWTANFSSDQVRMFAFTSNSITEAGTPLSSAGSPTEVVFHPASTSASGAALVSDFEQNVVTPITLTGTTMTAGGGVRGVPLAGQLDLIERGSQTGTVFCTSVSDTTDVSSVVRITLGLDGTAKVLGSVHDFGTTTQALPQGISVQR